ncbi:MAG: SDR family oxidoreductase [Pikeienuella sp.]
MTSVLITGAGRGVGAELARQMGERGDHIIAATRQGNAQAGAEALKLDVVDPASITALTETMANRSLDLLVCNAGALIGRGGLDDPAYTFEAFSEVLAVNVTGVFMTVRACAAALKRAGGKIAIISSQMGSCERTKGNAYLYRASKAAATNLACSLAQELKEEGVSVGAYHPGWVRTDMGGASADISAEESAAGLIQRFDALSLESTGCFEFYSGEPIPF